jgi:hypothetical protein
LSVRSEDTTAGGCLCGNVRYRVSGPLRDVVNCHCAMCQKLHGSFGAHSKAKNSDINITENRGLKWYRSSNIARRGFCQDCGSSLFWKPDEQDTTGILAGSLDQPTALKTMGHIFVGEKADFDEICDQYPQFDGSSDGVLKDDSL